MAARPWMRRAGGWAAAALLAAVCAGAVAPAAADDLQKLDASLKLVPADAAFYAAMLRNREQFDAVVNSRAWAKLMELPVVQMGLTMYRMQAADGDGPLGKFAAAMKDPEVRKLLDLAADMVSQEVFIYGESSCIGAIELLQNVYGAMRYGPIFMQLSGDAEGLAPSEVRGQMLLSALAEDTELLVVPEMVIGFRLSDRAAAEQQLARLEAILREAFAAEPEVKDCFKRQKIGGHEYLTLALNGEMIPWDDLPLDDWKDYETEDGDLDKVVEAVKEMTLVAAVGVRENYLLLAVGQSTEVLERLGEGDRLVDRDELKPLAKFAGRRLASIEYVSEDMAGLLVGTASDIDDMMATFGELLPLAGLDQEIENRITEDLDALAEDLKDLLPAPGAMLSFSFLTERGYEGYGYDWGEHASVDGTKPLGLLEHLGGSPLAAVLNRGKSSTDGYDTVVKWVAKGYAYFEELALPKVPPDERKQLDKFMAAVKPLVARLDKANREMLIPALADGQIALVLDAKLKSKRFIEALPATEKAMPMLEPALVVGVSDAKLLVQAFQEYRAVINGLLDAARQIEGSEVPAELTLPEPQQTAAKSGTIYSFVLPKAWGVDKKIAPNFGLSDTVGVFAISPSHTQRLLTAAPLKAPGVLAKAETPRAGAMVFDFTALWDAARPWVAFAFEFAAAEADNAAQIQSVGEQTLTVLDVLRVLRTATSESYFEGDALVTHWTLEIKDVP